MKNNQKIELENKLEKLTYWKRNKKQLRLEKVRRHDNRAKVHQGNKIKAALLRFKTRWLAEGEKQ